MQKMEIISASGNVKSTVVDGRYKFTQPGSTVRVEMPRGELIGSQKVNNDLILVTKNGENVSLENFFATENGLKNKLVLDDGGSLYQAEFDAQNFAGLGFTPVASMSDVVAAEEAAGAGISTAAWVLPLVGLAAVGAGVAIYNNRSSSDNGSSSASNSAGSSSNGSSNGTADDSAAKTGSMTIVEALETFVQSCIDSVQAVYTAIAESKPVEAIQTIASSICSGIDAVLDVIGTKIGAVWDSVTTVFGSVGEFISIEANFFGELFSIGYDTVASAIDCLFSTVSDGIGAVVSGITDAVSGAIGGMSLLDWINPLSWVGMVKDAVFGSISNVTVNLFDVITAIPGKIFDTVTDTVSQVFDAFTTKWGDLASLVTDTVSSVVGTLYEGFIQHSYDTFVAPIVDTVVNFISDPIGSISSLVSTVVEAVTESFDIVTSIIMLPCDLIGNGVALVGNLFDAIFNSSSDTSTTMVSLDAVLSAEDTTTASETTADNVTTLTTTTYQTDDSLSTALAAA